MAMIAWIDGTPLHRPAVAPARRRGPRERGRGSAGWITAAAIAVVAFFAPVPAHAQIGASQLTFVTTTTDALSYPFPSAAYSNNVLYICFTHTSVGAGTAPTVSGVSGAGLTFTEVGAAGGLLYGTSLRRIQAWRAMVTSGATTGVVTIAIGGATPSTGMGATMLALTGTKTSGTNGADAIANSATNTGTSTSLAVTLPAFADSSNRPVAFFGHAANEATNFEGGYTELYDGNHTTPNLGYEAEWHPTTAETTPSASWTTSSAAGGFALEIAAAPFEVRRAINVDFTKVTPCSGNLSNFPVLVSLSGNYLKTTANGGRIRSSSGYDIAFRAADGQTKLDHEVETWDGTAGTLVAWVRVPTLSYTVNTTIYLYYGNAGITTDLSNPAGVWDGNFRGVWHLKETPSGTMADSKNYDNNGTPVNMESADQVAAKANGGLDFDGTNEYVDAVDPGSLNVGQVFTVEAWVKRDVTGTGPDTVATKSYLTSGQYSFKLAFSNDQLELWMPAGAGWDRVNGATITDTLWHYVGGYSDGTNIGIFHDGTIDATALKLGTISYDAGSFLIGAGFWAGSPGPDIDGRIDEVRISSVARSDCWIGTTYNTINNPGNVGSPGFYSVGTEEYLVPTLILADHASGQVPDKLTNTTPVTDVFYRFNLTRALTVTVDTLRVNFTTGGGVANGDVSNGQLWVDNNNDGAIDGGDTQILPTVTPVGGVLTFTTNFTPGTSGTNYLVLATVSNLVANDTTTFSVGMADIDEVEAGISEYGTITDATHTQNGPLNLEQVHYRWRNDNGGETGLDLGTGADGSVTIAAARNINVDVLGSLRATNADGISTTVTANPTGTSISVASTTGFAANDEILLINLRGATGDTADVGNYEFLEVASVPNGTTLNLLSSVSLSYDGTTFANQRVIVQRVPQWTSVTINSGGSLTANDWTGTSGGLLVFRATGAVNVNAGGSLNVNGKGFRGGDGPDSGSNVDGFAGESYRGTGAQGIGNNLGGGGGGGVSTGGDTCGEGGAGGGYGTAGSIGGGTNGYSSNGACSPWTPINTAGAAYGVADLSKLYLGSGAGGGGNDSNSPGASGDGGDAAGIIYILADSITVNGVLEANGSNGQAAPSPDDNGHGGGGSGGSIRLAANSVTLAASATEALGGAGATGGTWSGPGGNGGVGRICVEAGTQSGTTNPADACAGAPPGTSATFMANEDTAITGVAKLTTVRLRLEVSNVGGSSSGSIPYRIEYATSTGGPWAAVPATATTEHWQMSASTYITDGQATSDINPGLTNANTTFVAGQLLDATPTTSGITLSTTQFTEIEYSIQATTNATDGQTYYFRVTNAGSPANFTFTRYGQATLAASSTTLALANHGSGQVSDKFTTITPVTDVLYRFKLTRAGTVTVSNIRVNYSTGSGIVNADVTAGALYRDNNNDGIVNGGDTALQTGIAGSGNQLAFTALGEIPSTGGTNYLVQVTVSNLVAGDTTSFSLGTSDIDEVQGGVAESGSITNATHTQNGGSTACALQVSETATTVTVTTPTSCELGFNAATGGGIDTFYDLAENPTRTNDLAGADGTFQQRTLLSDEVEFYTTDLDGLGGRMDLLEATPTRARVRSEGFYKRDPGWPPGILPGLKGLGDYSLYPSGRLALAWERRAASQNVTYDMRQVQLTVHYTGAVPLDAWNGYTETSGPDASPWASDTLPASTATDDYLLAQTEQAGARTDFLSILSADLTGMDKAFLYTVGTNGEEVSWIDGNGSPATPPATITAGTSQRFNLLTYYKPTNLVPGAAVTSRVQDYRPTTACPTCGPDDLDSPAPFVAGSGWFDADENTAVGTDFYNEAEAAYALDIDPAAGLSFTLGATVTTRYAPFFKIRQWRSLADPPTVTVGGATKTNDVHYSADVKPVSRASFGKVLFHTTLDSFALVTTPDIGNGTGGAEVGINWANPGRWGTSATFNATGDYVRVPLVVGGLNNIELDRGRIELWYLPTNVHDDGVQHDLFAVDNSGTGATGQIRLTKETGNTLRATLIDSAAGTHFISIPSTNYAWPVGTWVHLAVEWDSTAATDNVNVYMNGVELVPSAVSNGTFAMGAENAAGRLFIGNSAVSSINADGRIDDFTISTATTELAHGGLLGNPNEYLNDPTRNLTLTFAAVDGSRRGEYLYFGSDSEFRGLNVGVIPGAGVAAGALDWEYWNGTTWANLEAGCPGSCTYGFIDWTKSFTKTGNVFWTSDPGGAGGWRPYSINGGPDLFYVRVHLAVGASYGSNFPVESVIRTDILLFQYCADVTTDTSFVFPAPKPTAVELLAFEAVAQDEAVELRWVTGSELQNLGFHLYRSSSSEGPYQRITTSVIPGLGSSPVGASYSYVDSGLANGVTYFYKLEDIETTGKTEFHGPVQATPQAGTTSPGPGPSGGGSEQRISYGDPSNNGLRLTRLGASEVLLELITEGFYAVPQADGSVRIEVPGFEGLPKPGAPSIPTKRAWVEAVAGRTVRLGAVQVSDIVAFSGLHPMAGSWPDLAVDADGTVRPVMRKQREGDAFRRGGLYPAEAARLLEVAFQGEVKKALVDLSPLRWDSSSQQLLLAKRLVVRVVFAGVEGSEVPLGGSRGRRRTDKGAGGTVLGRLVARGRGLYGVRFEDVFDATGRGIPVSKLRLSRQGKAVAYHLEPEGGTYGPGSVLYFVSEGSSLNPYGREAVYELELGTGVVMPVVAGVPSGGAASYYWNHSEWEENRTYQAALLEARDLWLWEALVSPVSKTYPFTLTQLAPAGEPSRLSVWLEGASDFEADPDHHVRVSVNGVVVGEASWDGKRLGTIEAQVPAGVLQEGGNQLQVENVGDTGAAYSYVFLDRFALSYPRRLAAVAGVLWGSFDQAGTAEVGGLVVDTTAQAGTAEVGGLVEDTTAQPRWLKREGATFPVEAGRTYLAVDPGAVLGPEVRRPLLRGLRSRANRADYVLIAPREFLSAAEALLERRANQGLTTMAVAVEDIYEEFGHGEASPAAIKDFLAFAYHRWQGPSLRYVVLFGDGSYDYKGYVANGKANRVLPLLVKTTYLWTASDPSYGAVNGEDNLPDVAVGRLSASTLGEAQALVAKVLAFEDSAQSLAGDAVLVADNGDAAGDFEADSDAVGAMLGDREVERIYLRDLGSGARAAITDAFNRGASLVSYVGHGSTAVWATENMFNNGDVARLLPQSRQPFLMTMNCLNGFFHGPILDSLAEAFAKAPGKGAIAAFAPSGLSVNEFAHEYQKALIRELISARQARLGDVILAAQAAYTDSGAMPELLSIYHVFGDPGLPLR